MVALATPPPASRLPDLPDLPDPLTPELRSDLAYGRACGRSWKALAGERGRDPDALRRAAEADPEFEPARERAWADVVRKCESEGLARLRQIATGDDERRALRAAEALARYGLAYRRDQTRRAVEELRAEARRAPTRTDGGADAAPAPLPVPEPETPEELAARREHGAAEEAAGAGPNAPAAPEVYLWGGTHSVGRSVQPDTSDRRVRVVKDYSVGVGSRGAVYWVVPDGARPCVPGGDTYYPQDQPAASEAPSDPRPAAIERGPPP